MGRLKAVFWKIWCYRKTRYIITILELLVPLLAAYCIVFFNGKIGNPETENKKIYESYSKDVFKSAELYATIDVLYTPNNSDVTELMIKAMGKLKSRNINTFMAMKNETEMEDWFYKEVSSNETNWKIGYGIVINNINSTNLEYFIRNTKFDIWYTNLNFPIFQMPGPMDSGSQYITQGFTALQIVIDEAFMDMRSITPANWNLQEFPYPSYRRFDKFQLLYHDIIPPILCFSCIVSLLMVIKNIGEEKESGIKERLKMSGIRPVLRFTGWILEYSIIISIITLVATIFFTSWNNVKGDVFEKSNFIIIWFTLFLFYLSSILFAIAVANLFTKPRYSTSFGFFLWFIGYGLTSYLIDKTTSKFVMFLLTILPHGFLLNSLDAISRLEASGTGVIFRNLFVNSENNGIIVPLGVAWIAELIGLVLLFLLILYLDAILPGKYGVRKPWYFCCQKIFKSRGSIDMAVDETDHPFPFNSSSAEKLNFEPLTENLTVGIRILNIKKFYGPLQVLKNVSFDIYEDQITALLGHNGAGKTTLISIITGMQSPSSGEIKTNDYEVFNNFDQFRQYLGYCPQDNMLLPNMSVYDHLILFGLAKGLSGEDLKIRSDSVMKKCGLNDKRDTKISELSGGMQRKLCLAISLVTDPKILILDEPTSGLDPESRRAIWDILLALKKERTILLTTHFMEEADALGDRIAILSHGELKCYGTALFLKKNYGSGYHVEILLKPNTTLENIQSIIELIMNEIPEASVQKQTENISVQLPGISVTKFPKLFSKLENNAEFGVSNITISCTTMDDVFQKVNEEEGVKYNVDDVDMPLTYTALFSSSQDGTTSITQNLMLVWNRFYAIADKKFIWIVRNWVMAFLYVLLPLIVIVITTSKNSSTEEAIDTIKPLHLNLNIYGKTQVVMADDNLKYSESFKTIIKNSKSDLIVLNETSKSIVDELLNFGERDEANYRTSMIVAGNMSELSPTILYSSIGIHAIPIAINLMSNTILNSVSRNSTPYSINTYNYPYEFTSDTCSRGDNSMAICILITIVLLTQLTVVLSYFMIPVVTERITSFKQLQFLTGLQFYVYWFATFLVDLMIYSVVVGTLLVIIIATDSSGMFQNLRTIGSLLEVLFLFGVSGLWFSYFLTYFIKSTSSATLILVIFGLGFCIAGVIVILLSYTNWKYFFYLIPLQPFANAIFKILSESKFDVICEVCKGPTVDAMCKAKESSMDLEDFNFKTELIYLGTDWILYMILIFLIEFGAVTYIWNKFKSIYIGSIPAFDISDEDVTDELRKVRTSNKEDDESVLIVNGLAKKYTRNITAVKDVTFSIIRGKCFGLLGTNGAGKSTTFQMLSSYLWPTIGDASIFGYSLRRNQMKYKVHLGYCPQSGGLLSDLTANETLILFARLRGIPSSEILPIVNKWIQLLGLTKYQHKNTGTYSGGNLRKLSTAIALIGNPPVLLLDEPTTGVDPVTRRKIWQVIKMAQQNNQAIVITSHSMDECEALCDRLTIMVRGTMQCIGNIQYLKKVYGQGYTIFIKLKPMSDEELVAVKQSVETVFANCTLKDEYKGLLYYHIGDKTYEWSVLFENMESLKSEFPSIEDYALSDSTLEQVFLSFAARAST